MNNRQLEIRDFILSLAHKTLGITNQEIIKLFDEYSTNNVQSVSEIKTNVQTKILEISKEVASRNDEDNLFLTYGIESENDLLSFIELNREIGFYSSQIPTIHTFPLGGLKQANEKNRITTYDDYRVVSYLQNYYLQIPSYLKKDKKTLSDLLDISSFQLLRDKWQLQDYKDTLRYMIGTDADILELEAAYFLQQGYQVQRYQVSSIRNPYENHLFLGYEKNGKWYYFEALFQPFLGIHEFQSKEELENVVLAKFMTYYTSSFRQELTSMEQFDSFNKEKYQRAMQLQDKAIYDHRLSLVIDEENPDFSIPFAESCYEKWNASISLLESLPRTFEFYQLKRLRAPSVNSSYDMYQSYLYYQPKVKCSRSKTLYQMEQSLLKFAYSGILLPGQYNKNGNIFTYKEIEIPPRFSVLEEAKKEQQFLALLHQSLFQLVYHSISSGRSIIRLDYQGGFEQIKGIDLFDTQSQLYSYPLVQIKSPYALRITPSKVIQFRGMSSYYSLYREKVLHEQFSLYHFLCPRDICLIEFDDDFLDKYRLPHNGERPLDYLKRVGLSLRVDSDTSSRFASSYEKGLKFGQVRRHVLNPFRLADLVSYIEDEDKDKLKSILEFSSKITNDISNLQSYLLYFSKTLGTQLSILFNQNYFYQMRDNLDDITLSGEIVDDKFVSYYEALEEVELNYQNQKKNEKYDYEFECKKVQFSYFFQFFALARSLKILFDAFSLITKRNIETPIIIVFLGRFFGGLSYEKQDEFFAFYQSLKDQNELMTMLKNIFPQEYRLIRENKTFFRNILSILDDFSNSPQLIVDKTETILKDQEFLDSILVMKTEDRFVTYMKKRFLNSSLSLSNVTLNQICDNSKIGLLIRKEPIMVHTIASLLEYQIQDFSTFCEVGHDMIEFEKTKSDIRKEELRKKLAKYQVSSKDENTVIVLDLQQDDFISDVVLPTKLATSGGMATSIYLIFVILGMTSIVMGIILSFLL